MKKNELQTKGFFGIGSQKSGRLVRHLAVLSHSHWDIPVFQLHAEAAVGLPCLHSTDICVWMDCVVDYSCWIAGVS